MSDTYEIDVIVHGEMTSEAPTIEAAAAAAQEALKHRLADYRPIDAER